ncbi:hypothetical protein V8G54_024505 [Vigna mungo]|uniref:Uncharacterized protein n=1 Tax=Vigna mungo TaxID=3915 RepID=A0AAQ3RQ68_VIGMU
MSSSGTMGLSISLGENGMKGKGSKGKWVASSVPPWALMQTQTNIERKPQIRIVDDEGAREMVARSGDGGAIKGLCRRVVGSMMVMEEARRTKVMAACDLEWLRLRSPVDGHGCAHGGEDEDGGHGVHGVWARTKVCAWWSAAWLNGGACDDPNGCDGSGLMLGFGGEEKLRGRQRRENGYDGGSGQ